MRNPFKILVRAVLNIKDRLTRPLHIEFNLTDYCNLNCKGCSHYSPLAPAEFESLDSLENSMAMIAGAKNSTKLKGVYLIGGETLLFPWLKEAVVVARRYFPDQEISIFTNGLLIPKLDDELWSVIKENDIVMAITRYPIKFDYDKVENICKERGVRVSIFGDRGMENSFFKLPLDPEKRQRGWLSHFRCCAFGCVTVDNGRIFPCSQSACVRHLNNRFSLDFKWEKGDYIEVDKLKNINQIKRLRFWPVPFCGYCRHQTFTPYGMSKRAKEEWM